MPLFNLHSAPRLEGPATFSDGRVAALDSKKSFLITSPNADFVPEIVQGIVDVVLRSDGKYGPVDPIQWPQIVTPRYRYLSAIPKCVADPHPWGPMFRAPTREDFVVITGTPVVGFGLLRSQFVAPLRQLVSAMSQHVEKYLHGHGLQQSQELRWHELAMRHAASRLSLMSSTYPDQVLQVAELQRHWLMAAGYLEYERRFNGLTTVGRGFSCADHPLIGAWTSEPQVVQTLLDARIPVWFVRNTHLLHDDIRIGHVSPLLCPTALCIDRFPGVDNPLFHGLVGESHLKSMMQGGHGYLDISRVPSAAVYALADFGGVVSNREAKTLSRSSAQSASTSRAPPPVASHGGRVLAPTRLRPKPYDAHANQAVHPSQIRGRDKFLEFPHKWMPAPIATWSRAMSETDRSMPARPSEEIWGYWIPEPGLLLGPKDEPRQRRYISNWVRARPIWLYLLHVPNSRACQVAPQFWRSFLNGIPEDPMSTTRTGKRVVEIQNIFSGVFREEDFDVQTNDPVAWHGKTFQLVPDHLAPAVIWEVFDLGFRYELLALDRCLRSQGSRDRHDETQREEFLGSVFPGGWLRSLDSLPSPEAHGLFASLPQRRVSALNAFRQILVQWPACPDGIVSATPLQSGDTTQRIEEFELELARFYVDTFFLYSGRAPLVPHMYPV